MNTTFGSFFGAGGAGSSGGALGGMFDGTGATMANSFTSAPTSAPQASFGDTLSGLGITPNSKGYGDLPTMGQNNAQLMNPQMGSTTLVESNNSADDRFKSKGYNDVSNFASIQSLMNMAKTKATMSPAEYRDLSYQSNHLNRMLQGY